MKVFMYSALRNSVPRIFIKEWLLAFISGTVFCGGALAVEIPSLRGIPSAVAAAHPELVTQHTVLTNKRTALRARTGEKHG